MTVRRFAFHAACAAAIVLASSSDVRAEAYAGFRGGVNYARFTTNDVDYAEITNVDSIPGVATGRRLGFTGGGFIGVDYGKGLGFRIDLMYTQKGGTEDTTSVDLDYLELGTLFVYRYKLSERYTLRAFAGPVIGLWVNAELDLGPYDKDLGEVIEHWEFSGTIGAEFDMTAGPYVLLLEARYTKGTPVFKSVGLEGQPIYIDAANGGISVMTGVAVPF
jgi:hypothetical protein